MNKHKHINDSYFTASSSITTDLFSMLSSGDSFDVKATEV